MLRHSVFQKGRVLAQDGVEFVLEPDEGRITVNYSDGKQRFSAKLFLSVTGSCRYRISNGGAYEGEYCRWQVLRRAFERIFFDSLPPGVRVPGDYGVTI